MLNLDQVLKEYPESLRVFKRFAYKEYLQHKILDIIFKSQWGVKLSFLGGTALRICHDNQRFSEDLDFDNFGMEQEEFSQLAEAVKKNLEKEGFEVEIKNVFKGAYRCSIRFSKILFEYGLAPNEDEKILIQMDTMAHNFRYAPEKFLLNKFEVFREMNLTPLDIILSQKFYAIFNRKRELGRDYYDIVFLLGKTNPNLDYLKLKMNISAISELKEKVLQKCETLNFSELSRDVEPFIFDEDGKERVLQFKKIIEI